MKKNLTVIASASFLFGVNSSLSAEVLPDLVKAHALDELVENVETEVSNLKDAFNLTVSETVKGVNKTESSLQAQENVRYLNEHQRKANELERIANENARYLNEHQRKANELERIANENARIAAEVERKDTFDTLVDSAVIEQTVAQEVANEFQQIESTYANRLLSTEQQLADKVNQISLDGNTLNIFKDGVLSQSILLTQADELIVQSYIDSLISSGTITKASSGRYSIRYENTNFITAGKQLVNKDVITGGYFVNGANGTLSANASYFTTDFIPVTENATYTVSHYNGFMAYFDGNKNHVVATPPASTSDAAMTFTVPSGASYVRLATKITYLTAYQIENGSAATAVEVYYLTLGKLTVLNSNIKNMAITKDKIAIGAVNKYNTDFITGIENLYNPLFATDGYIITAATGVLTSNASYFASDYIAITPNTLYTINYFSAFSAFYDKDKNHLSGLTGGTQGNSYTFTSPDKAYYVRFSHNSNWGINKYGVYLSQGDTFKKSLGYGLIDKNLMANRTKNSRKSIKSIMSKVIFPDRQIKIKLIGDSITHGRGGTGFAEDGTAILTWSGTTFYHNTNGYCWANLFKSYMESKFNCIVTNNGVRGLNSNYLLQYIGNLISADDDIVICMIGTNDREATPAATAYQRYQKIYEYCYVRGIDIIFVCAPPVAASKETYTRHMEDINNLYNLLAEYTGYDYISVFNKFNSYCRTKGVALSTLLSDGLHPNDSGYLLMYQIILEEMGFGTKIDGATW